MPKRPSLVKGTKKDSNTLSYPGPDDYNEPPVDFDYYMKLIFGPKGSGKSTALASFPDSLTLMFEPKRKGLKIRQLSLQKYSAKEIMDGAPDLFQQVSNTIPVWIEDPTIRHLNFDSIDIFYESCYHSICASHKVASPTEAGKSSVDIWNELRDEFSAFFDALHEFDIGINMTSHVKERSEMTLDGGKMGFAAPSCSPACLQYIKQAVDIVIFYGWYDEQRAMMVRDDTNSSFVAPGVQGHFLQPNRKPLHIFKVPNIEENPKPTIYDTILSAFNNELWDMDTPEDERTPKKSPIKSPTKGTTPTKKKPLKRPK